jgi:hypothetical protein
MKQKTAFQKEYEKFKDHYKTDGYELNLIQEIYLPYWYCKQNIVIEKDIEVSSDMFELANKMATVSLLLANSIHSLKLNKLDLQAILNTAEVANKWLDITRSPAMDCFMKEVMPQH